MHALRKIGSFLAAALLPLFLCSFGLLFSLYQVIGSPDSIKTALKESRAYQTVVQDTLDSMRAESDDPQAQELPTQNPEIRRIFEQAFSAQFLQTQTESFLDDVYDWLRGGQPHLQFTIDLSDTKTALVDGLASYADKRLQELPRCTSQQEARELEALDVFSADCAPPTDRQTLVKQVRREVANLELFEDTKLTASDIKNNKGQTLEEQLQNVREMYESFRTGIYVAGVVSLLLIVGVVLLPPNWRPGARRASIIALAVGAASALLAWAIDFAIGKLSSNIAKDNPGEVVATFANALSYLSDDLRGWWLGYGLTLAGIGIAVLAVLYVIKKRQASVNGENSEPANKPHGKTQARTET